MDVNLTGDHVAIGVQRDIPTAGGVKGSLTGGGPQGGAAGIGLDNVAGKVKSVLHVDHARSDGVDVAADHGIGRGRQRVLDLVGGQRGEGLQQISYGS